MEYVGNGSEHFPPFRPCPVCGNDVKIILDAAEDWMYVIHCPCGISFGYPYGYNSRLDMANDWNELARFTDEN
jgi:hypothetical protein